MVLKARDYGFIGLKLKGLIFHESESRRAQGAVNIDGWEEKDCERKCRGRLTIDE
jgi:hypothetical protein